MSAQEMLNDTAHDIVQTNSKQAVTAIMNTVTDLDHAVEALHVRGFRKSDVSVLMPVTNDRQDLSFERKTKADKGSVLGGFIGALFGVVLGGFAMNGIFIIPGTEQILDQAPWLVVTSTVCFGTLIGALLGGMVGLGIPEYVTRLRENSIRGGTLLIAVHVDNSQWKQRAIDILKYYRAKDIVVNKLA